MLDEILHTSDIVSRSISYLGQQMTELSSASMHLSR